MISTILYLATGVLFTWDPVTDHGKRSKSGRLDLSRDGNGELNTVRIPDGKVCDRFSVLQTVYENGPNGLLPRTNMAEIRDRMALR